MGFLSWLFRGLGHPSPIATIAPEPAAIAPAPSDFGPFSVFYTELPPNYLTFLSMGSDAVQPALRTLESVFRATDDAPRYVELMLHERNWRPHVVAAVAALVSDDLARYVPALWQTFDLGSWMSPQLAVTLYLRDPGFRGAAKRRIVDNLTRSSARSRGKDVATLLRLLSYLPDETAWVTAKCDRSDVRAILSADAYRDRSADIADGWLKDVQAQFAQFGRELRPAAPTGPASPTDCVGVTWPESRPCPKCGMTVKVTVYPGDPVVWYDCATCHSKSVLTRYDEPWWPTSPPVGVSMPIDVRIIGNDVILTCRSDSNAFRALAEAIQSEAGQGRYGRFVLDLQGINEIDSQGLSELLRAYMTVRRQGGAMTVMNLTPRLEEVLAMSKLLAFFEGTEGDDPHTIGVAMPLPDSEPD